MISCEGNHRGLVAGRQLGRSAYRAHCFVTARRTGNDLKTCAADPTEPLGYVCTIQHSDFKWFPAGTKVHYVSQKSAGDVVEANVSIQSGSTDGTCVWSGPVNAVGTFRPGDGRLTQFHLVVAVRANEDASIWYWDGTYWFGGGD